MTLRAPLALAIALISSGCSSDPNADSSASGAEFGKDVSARTEPVGQWRVEQINTTPVAAQEPPILVSIGSDWIHASSQCVWWHWSWKAGPASKILAARAPFLTRSEPGEQPATPAMCARSLTRQENSFAASLESSSQIKVDPAGRVSFNSDGGDVTLRRLDGIAGRWSAAAINGKPITTQDYPINIEISDTEIFASSQCVWWKWRYRIAGELIAMKRIENDVPVCERSRANSENLFEKAMESATSAKLERHRALQIAGPGGLVEFKIGP